MDADDGLDEVIELDENGLGEVGEDEEFDENVEVTVLDYSGKLAE